MDHWLRLPQFKMAFASSGLPRIGSTSFRKHSDRLRPVHCSRALRASRARMSTAPTEPAIGLEAAWTTFSEKMRTSGESPPVAEWHGLLDECVAARESASKAIWVLSMMRDTGRKPSATTYERVLHVCALHNDRAAAFHLVELMWKDGVLLGDVELPEGMEKTLRTILPPEAFD